MTRTLPSGGTLTYTCLYEAYWANSLADATGDRDRQISVDSSADGGGAHWEFMVTEVADIGVKVSLFAEAWVALSEIPDFFEGLKRLDRRATLNDVRALLDQIGAVDATERLVQATGAYEVAR